MNEKTTRYLAHIDAYLKLNEQEQDDYLDGMGGDLLDNCWYALNEDERKYVEDAISKRHCETYGHDNSKPDNGVGCSNCGSKHPYKFDQ